MDELLKCQENSRSSDMSNLISRSALIERLEDLTKWCKDNRLSGLEQAMSIIHEQPTAYNVDKVVEQLEEKRITEGMSEGNNCCGCGFDAYTKAIEIVKGGGVEC